MYIDKSRSVVVGGEETDSVPVCSGVLQGSVLGQFLCIDFWHNWVY